MTTLDRAFIKAFAETPRRPTTRPTPVEPPAISPPLAAPALEPAWPSGRTTPLATAATIERAQPTLPLSTFSGATAREESLRARHEIDRLQCPRACQALLRDASVDWHWFVDHLVMQMGLGQKRIAMISAQRGAGRTTVCLAVALQLAGRGLRPLVIEADCEQPDLAKICQIQQYSGWGDAILSDTPLDDALVAAVEDGITLMPWRRTATQLAELAASPRASTSFNRLADHYDMLLLDAPPLSTDPAIEDFARFADAVGLDGVYVLNDCRYGDSTAVSALCEKLRQSGMSVDGLIENFVPLEAEPPAAPAEAI